MSDRFDGEWTDFGTAGASTVFDRLSCFSSCSLNTVIAAVPDRMSALVVVIKVIAGPIGQIAAIVAVILGSRPLQLTACAFGLFTAVVILMSGMGSGRYDLSR